MEDIETIVKAVSAVKAVRQIVDDPQLEAAENTLRSTLHDVIEQAIEDVD